MRPRTSLLPAAEAPPLQEAIWDWRCAERPAWAAVLAYDAEDAALAAAEDYDDEEFYLLRTGDAVEVEVRDRATGEVTRWSVEGEVTPRYHAVRI